jgi:voltage-gated potassium channel
VASVPGRTALNDPNLRDRRYELLEQSHLPHLGGSRFARLIVSIIVIDVVAMVLPSVPNWTPGSAFCSP